MMTDYWVPMIEVAFDNDVCIKYQTEQNNNNNVKIMQKSQSQMYKI